MGYKPKQRLKRSSKDKKWREDNIRYWRENCADAVLDPHLMNRNYRAAAGNLIEEDYLTVLNPTKSKTKNLTSYPARIRNYDIISPVILRMLAEYGEREFGVLVYSVNSNIDQIKIQAEQVEVLKMLQMQFNNQLLAEGVNTGFPEEELPSYEEIKNKVELIQDELVIQGQTAIEYLETLLKLPEKYREAFYHWLCTARVFTYKYIHRNEPDVDVVFPGELRYVGKHNLRYVHEADAVVRTFSLTINEIIDLFQDSLKEEGQEDVLEHLETISSTSADRSTIRETAFSDIDYTNRYSEQTLFNNVFGSQDLNNTDTIVVEHIVFRSQQLIYKYPIINDEGEPDFIELSDDFIPSKEEKEIIEEEWVDEIWEGWVLDDKFFTKIRPIEYLRGSINNPNNAPLPYGGKIFYSPYTAPVSFVEKGIPYQFNYNLVKYRAELTFAKTKDMILSIPLGVIPDKPGWDMARIMEYLERDSILWVDESKKNAQLIAQLMKTLNTNLHQYLKSVEEYAYNIKQEWYEVIGFNRQRQGEIKASDGKATTQEAIFRSNLSTEEYFKQFDEFRLQDYTQLLEISKFAWIGGKKAHFMYDKINKLLEINPEQYPFSDFGISPLNSRKELEQLEQLKAIAQPMAQQPEVPKKVIGEILASKSINEANKRLRQIEEEIQLKAEQIRQAAQEGEERIAQIEAQDKQAERDSKEKIADGNNATSIQVALINAAKGTQSPDDNKNPYDFIEEIQKGTSDLLAAQNENKKLNLEERKNLRDNDAKKYQADKQLEVAKENKNQYDKPKPKSKK